MTEASNKDANMKMGVSVRFTRLSLISGSLRIRTRTIWACSTRDLDTGACMAVGEMVECFMRDVDMAVEQKAFMIDKECSGDLVNANEAA